ncbi:MAG: trypsin-like peptidase domain-containing protein [Actinomycetes bacterium]
MSDYTPLTYPTQPLPTEPVPSFSDPQAPASGRRPIALVATTAVLAGLLGGAVGATAVAVTDNNSLTSPGSSTSSTTTNVVLPTGSVAAVARKVLPSVVSIQFTGASGSGEGSGVILTSDGRILTNNHVAQGAANGGSLTVTFHDGSQTSATIVGLDPTTDLAVIQADNVSGLTPATLGSSADLQVGESVVAIGSPLGLSGTVTTGIVSAKDRPVVTGGESGSSSSGAVLNAIQTDAAINPGNSGGALVNLKGEVVGINSAIASLGASAGGQSGSIGLGFAIPIDQAKEIVSQLVSGQTVQHGRLGVTVGDSTGDVLGAQLGQVTAGSAAAKAGLRSGDVITGYDSQTIDSADALVAAVRSGQPGDQVTVTYVRNGATATTTVTLDSDSTP